MNWLIAGVVLWMATHLMPALAPSFRQALIDRLGSGPYRGVFALIIVSALVLIVYGWRSTPETYLYFLPAWSRPAGFLLMAIAFLLIGAAQYKTIIKRFIRHPMLMGVVVWSISHLMTNGTTRALILFGGLGIWALIEMPVLNAREKDTARPDSPGLARELRGLAISAVIFAVVLYLHPHFTGMRLLPG